MLADENIFDMVSIIIPVYNAASTIEASLNSVLSQTYKGALEIIVVNDGSTDRSIDVISKIANAQTRIPITIINQPNGGVSKARNVGLKSAQGEYLALLDSDDEWHETKIEKQLNILEARPDIDFIGSLRNEEKITLPYIIKDGLVEITLRKLLFKITAQTSTALFKRSILSDVGYYNENMKYSEDANFWMKISKKKRMYLIPESLVVTGKGKPHFGFSGLSANIVEMERGVQYNIYEMFKLKYISWAEYYFFKYFSKFKFVIRKYKARKMTK